MPEIENLHAGSWRVRLSSAPKLRTRKTECISFARREANGSISEDSRKRFPKSTNEDGIPLTECQIPSPSIANGPSAPSPSPPPTPSNNPDLAERNFRGKKRDGPQLVLQSRSAIPLELLPDVPPQEFVLVRIDR